MLVVRDETLPRPSGADAGPIVGGALACRTGIATQATRNAAPPVRNVRGAYRLDDPSPRG
jgi:hypothetical protein